MTAAACLLSCWMHQRPCDPHGEDLHLVDLGLTSLPDVMGEFNFLQRVFLDGNRLQTLPESLSRLSNLSCLDLGRNRFAALPEALTRIPGLQLLNLSDNCLTRLPDSIGDCENLQELIACRNEITELPASIAALFRLQYLDLNTNRLHSLPECFTGMTSLEALDVAHNALTTLPKSLGDARNLAYLIAAHNQLTALPDELCFASELADIAVEHNQITALPMGIATLEGLVRLDLSNNQFTQIPPPPFNGLDCEIWMINNPLAEGEVERYRALPERGHLVLSDIDRESHSDRVATPLAPALARWREHIPELPDRPWHHAPHPNAEHFGGWLSELRETREFANDSTRDQLIERVRGVLREMDSNETLRETLLHVAHEATATCTDNVILGLNNMEMACQNEHAARGELSESQVMDLGRRMFRVQSLNQIAERHVARQEAEGIRSDPVEVHLALQVRLRERLNLPVSTRTMQFAPLAALRDSQVDSAGREIEALEEPSPRPFVHAFDTLIEKLDSDTPPMLDDREPRHALAEHLAVHYQPWQAHVSRHNRDDAERHSERMHRYIDWLSGQTAGHDEQTLLLAHRAAMFYANHGLAYRRALSAIQSEADTQPEKLSRIEHRP